MLWDLISISEAAKLLYVSPATLRYLESPDGQWTEYDGLRIRVYRWDDGQRRYDRNEILRAIQRRNKKR